MRNRLIRSQLCTIRPLIPQDGDVFGDASVMIKDTRDVSFRVKVQITWIVRAIGSIGFPGTDSAQRAICMVRLRDVPIGAKWLLRTPVGPLINDVVETIGISGSIEKLYVRDVQPSNPRRRSLGRPDGGFDGWRLSLTDQTPALVPSATYER